MSVMYHTDIDNNLVRFKDEQDNERIYDLTRCGGPGCPYTASWLIHINLFKKIQIWLDSTKMEAASFLIFDKAHLKFQLSDPDAYYVHHMSMYEHLVHKKYGFDISKNKTYILSQSAYNGECNNFISNVNREYIAIIPFYGGLPPNVTSDMSVKSIGQGNSLVNAETKALQCMATICSCLKYFGQVVVGVVRDDDRTLMLHMLDNVDVQVKARVHVIQFKTEKPAHLPFHLMAWTQKYIQWYNCEGESIYPSAFDKIPHRESVNTFGYYDHSHGKGDDELKRICHINLSKHHHSDYSIVVVYHRRSIIHRFHNDVQFDSNKYNISYNDFNSSLYDNDFNITNHFVHIPNPITISIFHNLTGYNISEESKYTTGKSVPINYWHPIKYIYYTESDQIVKFDSDITFQVISKASNESTFYVGRRREKDRESDPSDYLGSLNNYRNCGQPGYSIHWPNEHIVRHTQSR